MLSNLTMTDPGLRLYQRLATFLSIVVLVGYSCHESFAQSFDVLHYFDGMNGQIPRSGLTLANSVLYGTTDSGGDWDRGVVYSMNLDGSDYQVLHSFDGPNGRGSHAEVNVIGSRLYGTTPGGGGI